MIVTRFAPSPTGLLHLGHAFAAITAHDAAADARGRFLLRVEDIDGARCRPEFEDAIFEDLHWLGLRWEEPVLRQSARFVAYRAALKRLETMGLLYPCFCTRKEIADEIARAGSAPHGPEGPIYPGTCRAFSRAERMRRMESGGAYALRLDADAAVARTGPLTFEEKGKTVEADPARFGDIVLARKDIPASYHLAVVVDDAFQGVSLVTRGEDLLAATSVQRLLQALLGLPVPAYAHHRLIVDGEGKKLSKRDGAVTLNHLRDIGGTADEVRARLGMAAT